MGAAVGALVTDDGGVITATDGIAVTTGGALTTAGAVAAGNSTAVAVAAKVGGAGGCSRPKNHHALTPNVTTTAPPAAKKIGAKLRLDAGSDSRLHSPRVPSRAGVC